MKRYLLGLLCLVGGTVSAQKHTLTFQTRDTDTTKRLRVALPVGGTAFPVQDVYDLRSGAPCKITNTLQTPGFVQVYYGKSFLFFIDPKKNYTITFDTENIQRPFAFSGDNAEGQYLLNKLKHLDYQDRSDKYLGKDSVFTHLVSAINNDETAEREQYATLLQQKKISNTFYQYVISENAYHYAAVLASAIFTKNDNKEFTDAWPSLFKTHSITDSKALVTTSFYDYADQYANYYRTSYQRKITGNIKRFDIRKSNEYLVDWYHRYADNLPEPSREYMLARFLERFIKMKKYETELVDLYTDFNKRYPESVYNKYLQPGINDIVAFHQKATAASSTESKIPDNYLTINSLQALLEQHKDKTVFVDIWATWCGPCKEEFAYNAALHEFLKNKNAEVLYISTDLNERDKEWRDMIKFYNLAGTNIRTSDKLRQDLINKLWGGKGYAIPRYVIIKNGEIVVSDALRPSDKQKLYDQISKYL